MDTISAQLEECPDGETHNCSKDGVDLTLIRWMLSLSHRDRLLVLQQNIRSIMRLRRASRN